MRFPRSSKFAPLMPVAKVGFPPPVPFPSNGYRNPGRDAAGRNVESPTRRFSTADLRHTFVVKVLKKHGIFKPRLSVYVCLGCKYAFLVNDRRGLMVAVDRKAQPIPDPENSRRLATFAQGPCPALKSATQRKRRETVEVLKPRLRLSTSSVVALIARIGTKTRYPYFVESNLHPPDGITPQDLLS